MRQHTTRLAALLLVSALTACGGGDYHAPVSLAPVANAGPAQTVDAGTVVTLAGSGSDANQDVITYLWTLTKPATSVTSLENYHVATPTFTADVAGTYVATLTTNDKQLDSAPSSVTITAQVPVKAFVAIWGNNACNINQRIWIIDGHLVFTAVDSASDCINTASYQLYDSTPSMHLCQQGGLAITSLCVDAEAGDGQAALLAQVHRWRTVIQLVARGVDAVAGAVHRCKHEMAVDDPDALVDVAGVIAPYGDEGLDRHLRRDGHARRRAVELLVVGRQRCDISARDIGGEGWRGDVIIFQRRDTGGGFGQRPQIGDDVLVGVAAAAGQRDHGAGIDGLRRPRVGDRCDVDGRMVIAAAARGQCRHQQQRG